MFSGIESGFTSIRAIARSMRSSSFSPIPTIPPEQISNPAARAFRMVLSRSWKVCVVQIEA